MKLRLNTIIKASILFALFLAFTSYTNSTLLESIFGDMGRVQTLYSIGGGISLVLLGALAHVRSIKTPIILLFSLLLVSMGLLVIRPIHAPYMILWAAGALYLGIATGLIYLLDLLVEAKSADSESGSVRGRYLAFQNAAWIVAPIVTGIIVDSFGIDTIYSFSCAIIVGLILFVALWRHTPRAIPEETRAALPRSHRYHRTTSFIGSTVLNMFYAVMIIITPIYLTTYAGWSWLWVGGAFTAMLAMFPLVQKPLGKWLDRHRTEYQSIQSIGLSLAAVSSIGVFILAPNAPLLGVVMLITSRIGAASVEIATDAQFFSTVDSHDRTLIAWYRGLTPIAYLISPIGMMLVHSQPRTIFMIMSELLAITAIIAAGAYAYERTRRSLTMRPSSK